MIFLSIIKLAAATLMVTGSASAEPLHRNQELDRVLSLEVNAAGLTEIAAYIRATVLADIENMELPDVEDKVDGGVEVKASGLHLWASFGDSNLVATAGHLNVTQQIIRIRLHADTVRLRKKILGNWVSTTCEDTDITAVESETVALTMALNAAVADRRVSITERQTDFSIPEDQFEVDGPRKCSGALGVGNLIRLMAQSLLKNSRSKIEDSVENRVRDLIPGIADNLNRAVNKRFEINLNQPPLPTTKAAAVTFPFAVLVDPDLLSFTIGTDLQAGPADKITDEAEIDDENYDLDPNLVDIGAAGINPTIVTEAFRTVFTNGTPWVELNAGNTPGLSDALDVSSASGIWPDLNEIPLTARKLRLSIRLASAPVITIPAQNNYISINVPKLEMMFMAQINGQWVNYFKLNMGLNSGLGFTRVNQQLVIHMAGPKTLSISGNWAPGYTPVVPIFEQDVAELIFKSVIDFLYDSGPLSVVDIPSLTVGNGTITAGNVRLMNPFISVRINK